MYGTTGTLVTFGAFLALILLGLFLCRYGIKYLTISFIGLVLTLALLFNIATGIITLLYDTHPLLYIVIDYLLPVVSIFLIGIILARFGLYIYTKSSSDKNNNLGKSQLRYVLNLRRSWANLVGWFNNKSNVLVVAIILSIMVLHLKNINKPVYMIGDESFYVSEANRVLHGQPLVLLEHPPLGKWIIAAGMFTFGNNAIGWRIFPIIFGTASILLFYLICVTLVRSSFWNKQHPPSNKIKSTPKWFESSSFIPVLATFLFAIENTSFILAHLAMLDVFSVTFMLLGFLFYLKSRYLSAGVALGLSLLCKETAIFGILVIIIHWTITHWSDVIDELKYMWRAIPGKNTLAPAPSFIMPMSKLMISVPVVWSVLLPLLEYVKTPLWGAFQNRLPILQL